MPAPDITLEVGLPDALRCDAARLYLDAFQDKIGGVLGRGDRALRFLADNFRTSQVMAARAPNGHMLGLAGFHDANGGFVGGDFGALSEVYGLIGAAWRGAALTLLEREAGPDELLLDGVVVAPAARGQGVGGMLLDAAEGLAADKGLTRLRLDVIDSNIRARQLYERRGFVVDRQRSIGPFRHIYGFRRADSMVKAIMTEDAEP